MSPHRDDELNSLPYTSAQLPWAACGQEPPTLHPQPRRLHQTLEIYSCESETTPKGLALQNVDKAPGDKTPEFGLVNGTDLIGHWDKVHADAKSPDLENNAFSGKDWSDSPNLVVMPRSVQNTPEHVHYGSTVGNLMPMPSLSAMAWGASGETYRAQPVFPHTLPITSAQIGQVPTPMSNFTNASMVPAQMQMQACVQGLLQGVHAGNPQDAHQFSQLCQATMGTLGPQSSMHWRMLNVSMPTMPYAPQQNCADDPSSPWFGQRVGSGVPDPRPAAFPTASAVSAPGIALGISAGPVGVNCDGHPDIMPGTSNHNKIQLPSPVPKKDAGRTPQEEALPREIMEIRGQVAEMSRTQAGSKYLQKQLARGLASVTSRILSEVEEDLAQLMCDQYGNYLCNAAFHSCSLSQRIRMLTSLSGKIEAISCDKRGTHALQALIGLLNSPEEQRTLMQEVQGSILSLCMDPNGTHVVQRLLLSFLPPITDEIYNSVVLNLVEIAHHPYGLCVVKKCITHVMSPSKHQDMLVAQMAAHALDLVQSPYGNYAVQHALDEWGGTSCQPILLSLRGYILQLSMQKFSSNVVEKLLESACPTLRAAFVNELTDEDKNANLVSSTYGHYVVRRVLQIADIGQVSSVLKGVYGHVGNLTNRRLRAKWEKVLSLGSERLKKRA